MSETPRCRISRAEAMTTALLLLHSFVGVALLGAVTHQAFAASRRAETRKAGFIGRFRATDPGAYSNAVVALFVAASLLGAILYPDYRRVVRPLLQTLDMRSANGAFELKEHFSALGLALLPAYWAVWKRPAADYASARLWLTWMLAAMVWWNFVVGEVLVIIKGLFP
jgi:hypothetical protein